MIEASFEAVVPKAINAEFEAIIPREKAFDIVNKNIHIDANGRYEVKADAGTAMTQVNVEVEVPNNIFQETMIDNTGYGIHQQKVAIIADGVTTIIDNAYSRTSITHIYIPDTLERINYSAFHTANKLKYISPIPPSLNYIGQQAFAYTILKYLDCRRCVSIPTLGGTAAFPSGIIIVVPDTLYDEWIVATNWATYADIIVKAEDFEKQNNNA